MKPYHKINAPFKRDMDKRNHPLIVDDWAVEEFKILRNIRWSAREKIDGTNIRVNYFDGELTFSGRTDAAIIPNNLLEKLIDMFPIKNFSGFKDGITLYGEGYGHKIQSGGKYLRHKKTSFALFDVRVGEWWLKEKDIEDIATSLGIECAPPSRVPNPRSMGR